MTDRLRSSGLIGFILVVAALLRFWNYPALTFTYDELNAMGRTVYPDFGSLIKYGVKVDSHPSLIQVFLWAWSHIFGDSEASIKFPFVIMGIASVYLAYRAAKKFFGDTCGIIVACFIAALQYTVMYSQIARPYVSGMFFALGLVNALHDYSQEGRVRSLVLIFLFSELCLYNHHFSACFAFSACLFAFLFIPRRHLKNYFVAGLLIALAYLPELPVTLYQLSVVSYMGGLAGIATPENNYLPKFLEFALHYSMLMYAVAGALIIGSLWLLIKQKDPAANKYRLYCILLFITPYLVGFFYSTNVSQVLQYSTLIFGFPFLLMAVFSGFPPLSPGRNALIAAVVLIPCTYTLTVTRKHYTYFYEEPFDAMYRQTAQLSDSLAPGKVNVHMNVEPYFHYYYHKKYGHNIRTLPRTEVLDIGGFRRMADTITGDYFILTNPYDEYAHLVRERFPYLIHRSFSYSMNLYCYSRNPAHKPFAEQFPLQRAFTAPARCWSVDAGRFTADSMTKAPIVSYKPDEEWGLLFSDTISNLTHSFDEKINFAFEYYGDSINCPLVACDVFESDSKKAWMGYELSNYALPANCWKSVYYSVNSEYLLTNFSPGALLKFYVWNNKKAQFRLRNIRVFTTKFNKNLFKLMEPLNP